MGKIRQASKKVSKGEPKSTGNPFKDFSRKTRYYGKQINNSSAANTTRQIASAVQKGLSVSSQKKLALKLIKGLF